MFTSENKKNLLLAALVFSLSAVIFYFFDAPLFADEDTPWHIASGELLRQFGKLPEYDTWSFTNTGNETKWLYIGWIWQLSLGYLAAWGGLKAVFLFMCGFKAIIISVLSICIMRRKETNAAPFAVLFVCILAALALLHTPGARGQFCTFLFLIMFQAVLHKSREMQSLKTLLLLPLLMILWVNIHGAFIYAAIVYVAYTGEAIYEKNYKWLKNMIVSGILCIPAIFISPLGIEIVPALLRAGTVINLYVSEWQSYKFGVYGFYDIFLLVFVIFSSFRYRAIPFADKFLTIIWIALAANSARSLIILILLSAPYLTINIIRVLEDIKFKSFFFGLNKIFTSNYYLLAVTIVFMLFFAVSVTKDFREKISGDYVLSSKVPYEELKFMRENYPGKKFLNEYDYGGYMIYYNQGVNKVFVDGRIRTAYPESIMKEMVEFIESKNQQEILDKYDVEGLLLKKNNSIYKIPDLGAKWIKVMEGKTAEVYLRNDLVD